MSVLGLAGIGNEMLSSHMTISRGESRASYPVTIAVELTDGRKHHSKRNTGFPPEHLRAIGPLTTDKIPYTSDQPILQRNAMPTPESEAFKAKKPTVPPTYDGVDFEDTTALHNARDAIIREQWVRSMMGRLVGEELGKCYRREGVNHLEKCGKLRGEIERTPEERGVGLRSGKADG